MSKLKIFIGIGVVVAAIAGAPLVVKQVFDNSIEANKSVLEGHGFKQEILNSEGYFTTTREFQLEVVDAAKVWSFLLDALATKNPQYKMLADNLKTQTTNEINEIFNGMQFRGDISNSNLLPFYVRMNVALSGLPTTMREELKAEPELEKVIMPLIEKGAFGAHLVFSRDNKLKIAALKDIQEELKLDTSTLKIDTVSQAMRLDENNGVTNGTVEIVKQAIGLKDESVDFTSQLDNLKYVFSYKDDFNNKVDLNISSYKFFLNAYDDVTELSFDKVKAISIVDEKEKVLHVKGDYTVDNLLFSEYNESLKIAKTLLTLTIDGLRSDTLKKIQTDYNALLMGGANAPTDDVIIADFVALINNGVKFNAAVNAQSVSGIITLKDVGLDLNVTLPQNNYSDKQSPLEIANLLEIASRVKVHKEDKKTLEELAGSTPEMNYGRAEGDFFVYDVAMKKGQVTVNGKALQ